MNGKDIAKAIELKIKNELELLGYQFSISSDWFRTSVVVSKKDKKVNHTFRFLIEQNSGKNPVIYGFGLHTCFPELEIILRKILKNNSLIGKSSKNDDTLDSFKIECNLKNALPEEGLEIKSDKDIDYIIELFHKFYKEDALPFFNRWNSLPILYDYIKELPEDRKILSEILEQFYQLKKATIYRLCNDPSALDYILSYYERRKEIYINNPEEIVAERYYNASKELKEVLETITPIYNLNI